MDHGTCIVVVEKSIRMTNDVDSLETFPNKKSIIKYNKEHNNLQRGSNYEHGNKQ